MPTIPPWDYRPYYDFGQARSVEGFGFTIVFGVLSIPFVLMFLPFYARAFVAIIHVCWLRRLSATLLLVFLSVLWTVRPRQTELSLTAELTSDVWYGKESYVFQPDGTLLVGHRPEFGPPRWRQGSWSLKRDVLTVYDDGGPVLYTRYTSQREDGKRLTWIAANGNSGQLYTTIDRTDRRLARTTNAPMCLVPMGRSFLMFKKPPSHGQCIHWATEIVLRNTLAVNSQDVWVYKQGILQRLGSAEELSLKKLPDYEVRWDWAVYPHYPQFEPFWTDHTCVGIVLVSCFTYSLVGFFLLLFYADEAKRIVDSFWSWLPLGRK